MSGANELDQFGSSPNSRECQLKFFKVIPQILMFSLNSAFPRFVSPPTRPGSDRAGSQLGQLVS
jgi:hypothetical protein